MTTREVLNKEGTTKTWRGTGGDYGISLESLATTKAAQGAKGDLGPKWADVHNFEIAIETGASAPAKGESFELWWAASVDATAGLKNPGGTSGTDIAYKDGEEDEWKVQLQYIGALVVTGDSQIVQRQYFKKKIRARYGMPVVVNKTGQTTETDHNEHYIAVHPVVPELQSEV